MGVKSQLESDYDYEIVSEFINHFDLAVDSMEILIANLDKPEYYSRNVDELFRIFHNIKSATGYLHLRFINKLVTDVESLLEKMRNLPGPASEELIDWLFACSDHMAAWNDNIRLDERLSPIPDILINLPQVEQS